MSCADDQLRNIDEYVEAWNKVEDYYWKRNKLIAIDIKSFVNPITNIVNEIWYDDDSNDVYNYGMKEYQWKLYHKVEEINLQLFYYLKNNDLWDEITNYFAEETIEYLEDITRMKWVEDDPLLNLKTKYNWRSIYKYHEGYKWIIFRAYFKRYNKNFEASANSIEVEWNENKDHFFKWFDKNWRIIKDYCDENHEDGFEYFDIKIYYDNPVPNIQIYKGSDKVATINKNAKILTKDAFINLTTDQHKYPIINTGWKFKIPTMLLSHKEAKFWDDPRPELYLAIDPTWLDKNQICFKDQVYSKPKAGFTYAWVIDYWWDDKINQNFFDKEFENFYLQNQIKDQSLFQILQCNQSVELIDLDDYT